MGIDDGGMAKTAGSKASSSSKKNTQSAVAASGAFMANFLKGKPQPMTKSVPNAAISASSEESNLISTAVGPSNTSSTPTSKKHVIPTMFLTPNTVTRTNSSSAISLDTVQIGAISQADQSVIDKSLTEEFNASTDSIVELVDGSPIDIQNESQKSIISLTSEPTQVGLGASSSITSSSCSDEVVFVGDSVVPVKKSDKQGKIWLLSDFPPRGWSEPTSSKQHLARENAERLGLFCLPSYSGDGSMSSEGDLEDEKNSYVSMQSTDFNVDLKPSSIDSHNLEPVEISLAIAKGSNPFAPYIMRNHHILKQFSSEKSETDAPQLNTCPYPPIMTINRRLGRSPQEIYAYICRNRATLTRLASEIFEYSKKYEEVDENLTGFHLENYDSNDLTIGDVEQMLEEGILRYYTDETSLSSQPMVSVIGSLSSALSENVTFDSVQSSSSDQVIDLSSSTPSACSLRLKTSGSLEIDGEMGEKEESPIVTLGKVANPNETPISVMALPEGLLGPGASRRLASSPSDISLLTLHRPLSAAGICGNRDSATTLLEWMRAFRAVSALPDVEFRGLVDLASSPPSSTSFSIQQNKEKARRNTSLRRRYADSIDSQSDLSDFVVSDDDEDFGGKGGKKTSRKQSRPNSNLNGSSKLFNSKSGPNNSSFCVDDYGGILPPLCLLMGPTGTGKTASVYACAGLLNASVIEVHPGQMRDKKTLLDLLKEATKSRNVRMSNTSNIGASGGGGIGAFFKNSVPSKRSAEDIDPSFSVSTNLKEKPKDVKKEKEKEKEKEKVLKKNAKGSASISSFFQSPNPKSAPSAPPKAPVVPTPTSSSLNLSIKRSPDIRNSGSTYQTSLFAHFTPKVSSSSEVITLSSPSPSAVGLFSDSRNNESGSTINSNSRSSGKKRRRGPSPPRSEPITLQMQVEASLLAAVEALKSITWVVPVSTDSSTGKSPVELTQQDTSIVDITTSPVIKNATSGSPSKSNTNVSTSTNSSGMTVILIELFDTLILADSKFVQGLRELVAETRCPIIATISQPLVDSTPASSNTSSSNIVVNATGFGTSTSSALTSSIANSFGGSSTLSNVGYGSMSGEAQLLSNTGFSNLGLSSSAGVVPLHQPALAQPSLLVAEGSVLRLLYRPLGKKLLCAKMCALAVAHGADIKAGLLAAAGAPGDLRLAINQLQLLIASKTHAPLLPPFEDMKSDAQMPKISSSDRSDVESTMDAFPDAVVSSNLPEDVKHIVLPSATTEQGTEIISPSVEVAINAAMRQMNAIMETSVAILAAEPHMAIAECSVLREICSVSANASKHKVESHHTAALNTSVGSISSVDKNNKSVELVSDSRADLKNNDCNDEKENISNLVPSQVEVVTSTSSTDDSSVVVVLESQLNSVFNDTRSSDINNIADSNNAQEDMKSHPNDASTHVQTESSAHSDISVISLTPTSQRDIKTLESPPVAEDGLRRSSRAAARAAAVKLRNDRLAIDLSNSMDPEDAETTGSSRGRSRRLKSTSTAASAAASTSSSNPNVNSTPSASLEEMEDPSSLVNIMKTCNQIISAPLSSTPSVEGITTTQVISMQEAARELAAGVVADTFIPHRPAVVVQYASPLHSLSNSTPLTSIPAQSSALDTLGSENTLRFVQVEGTNTTAPIPSLPRVEWNALSQRLLELNDPNTSSFLSNEPLKTEKSTFTISIEGVGFRSIVRALRVQRLRAGLPVVPSKIFVTLGGVRSTRVRAKNNNLLLAEFDSLSIKRRICEAYGLPDVGAVLPSWLIIDGQSHLVKDEDNTTLSSAETDFQAFTLPLIPERSISNDDMDPVKKFKETGRSSDLRPSRGLFALLSLRIFHCLLESDAFTPILNDMSQMSCLEGSFLVPVSFAPHGRVPRSVVIPGVLGRLLQMECNLLEGLLNSSALLSPTSQKTTTVPDHLSAFVDTSSSSEQVLLRKLISGDISDYSQLESSVNSVGATAPVSANPSEASSAAATSTSDSPQGPHMGEQESSKTLTSPCPDFIRSPLLRLVTHSARSGVSLASLEALANTTALWARALSGKRSSALTLSQMSMLNSGSLGTAVDSDMTKEIYNGALETNEVPASEESEAQKAMAKLIAGKGVRSTHLKGQDSDEWKSGDASSNSEAQKSKETKLRGIVKLRRIDPSLSSLGTNTQEDDNSEPDNLDDKIEGTTADVSLESNAETEGDVHKPISVNRRYDIIVDSDDESVRVEMGEKDNESFAVSDSNSSLNASFSSIDNHLDTKEKVEREDLGGDRSNNTDLSTTAMNPFEINKALPLHQTEATSATTAVAAVGNPWLDIPSDPDTDPEEYLVVDPKHSTSPVLKQIKNTVVVVDDDADFAEADTGDISGNIPSTSNSNNDNKMMEEVYDPILSSPSNCSSDTKKLEESSLEVDSPPTVNPKDTAKDVKIGDTVEEKGKKEFPFTLEDLLQEAEGLCFSDILSVPRGQVQSSTIGPVRARAYVQNPPSFLLSYSSSGKATGLETEWQGWNHLLPESAGALAELGDPDGPSSVSTPLASCFHYFQRKFGTIKSSPTSLHDLEESISLEHKCSERTQLDAGDGGVEEFPEGSGVVIPDLVNRRDPVGFVVMDPSVFSLSNNSGSLSSTFINSAQNSLTRDVSTSYGIAGSSIPSTTNVAMLQVASVGVGISLCCGSVLQSATPRGVQYQSQSTLRGVFSNSTSTNATKLNDTATPATNLTSPSSSLISGTNADSATEDVEMKLLASSGILRSDLMAGFSSVFAKAHHESAAIADLDSLSRINASIAAAIVYLSSPRLNDLDSYTESSFWNCNGVLQAVEGKFTYSGLASLSLGKLSGLLDSVSWRLGVNGECLHARSRMCLSSSALLLRTGKQTSAPVRTFLFAPPLGCAIASVNGTAAAIAACDRLSLLRDLMRVDIDARNAFYENLKHSRNFAEISNTRRTRTSRSLSSPEYTSRMLFYGISDPKVYREAFKGFSS